MTMTARRLPAYGRELRAGLATGARPTFGICIFLDRPAPRSSSFAPLALFKDQDPSAFDWRLCQAQDVWIPDADRADPLRLSALVREVVAVQPKRLILLLAAAPGYEIVVDGGGQ